MKRAKVSCWSFACLLWASLSVVSCGGGESGGNPVSSTQVSAPRLLQQGNFSLPAPDEDGAFFAQTAITDPSAGLWEATVDWAIATNTLWMWVANGTCTVEQFARPDCPFEVTCPCQFTIRSETATPKPRVLTIPNAPGGTRTLIVLNLGPREEEATYRVMLTPSSLLGGVFSTTGDRSDARAVTGRKAVQPSREVAGRALPVRQ